MPRTKAALFTIVAILVLGTAPSRAARPSGKETPMPLAITRWLVLGPTLDPLPLFHEEKAGGFGIDDLLKADRFPRRPGYPAEGAEESWFGKTRLRWTAREADGGLMSLAPPEGVAEGRPATAWLAAYLTADRFMAVKARIAGAHPRRVWLDGEQVAIGGAEAKPDAPEEIKATLELATGRHLVLVESIYDPKRAGAWQVGVACEPEKEGGPVPRASLDLERDLDILDVLDAPQVTALAVSPAGDLAAITLRRVLPGTDDAETWLELRRADGGGLVRSFRGAPEIRLPAWDPAGKWFSYVTAGKTSSKEKEVERSTLWLLDLESQAIRPLLEEVESLTEYEWAPDGTAVVFTCTVKPEADKRGVKRLGGLLDRQKDYRVKSYLHLATVPGGTRRRLTAGALSASGASFSPDGRRLLFLREVEDLAARPYSRKEVWELDLSTYEARKLRDGRWIDRVQYDPEGKRILVTAGPSEFGEAGVGVPAGVIPNEGDLDLFVWNPSTGEVEAITREFDPAVSSAAWSRDDGNVYLKAEDRDRVRLFRYEVRARSFTALDVGFDVVQETAFAYRAPVAVASGTSPWSPEAVATVDLRGGGPRILARPAEAWFEKIRRGKVESWSFTSSGGRAIDGRVYLPPGYDPGSGVRLPAIVYYYGGTSPVSRDFGGRYPKEWWAVQGYAVYVPQPSGATGFGQEYSARHVNDWGEITSREVIEAARAFLEAHPYVDPKRVGCIGASFGGFLTELIITKTDLFAAAVSHAGISSISSYWGEGYWGYSYSAQATAGSFPWNRPDIYVERSPLFRADKVKTPVLLTHGAADTNVPPGESDSFYTALKLLGVPVEYLQVEGTDHTVTDHAKRLVWSRAVIAWFDRWLKGQPEWWEHLFKE